MKVLDVRNAGVTDADSIAAILSGWIDATDWMPRIHTVAEDHGFVSHLIELGRVRVAELDRQIEGFISQQKGEVEALYVSRPGQGVGSALLRDAQNRCERLSLWTFAANAGARRFYARHGFTEVGATDGDNDEGLPDVRMTWEAERNV